MRKYGAILVLLAIVSVPAVVNAQKWEGLAETPQMGWNSWNKFGQHISEELIRQQADAMVAEGLVDAGYIYLNMDDCWHGERDADGFVQPNPETFPSGILALANYVHSKGMKLGIYSDAGRNTCAGKTGSLGHEYQDALQYARWEIDYLKYDWCACENVNPRGAYTLMRDALRAAGRPILFSMCEWGTNKPWEWAAGIGHSWRTTGDITARFAGNPRQRGWGQTVLSIIDQNAPLRKYAGPGHWNDPDMLEVGNGMTVNEDRAHFTMWCMMAAPLILGNDLSKMTDETRAIILNKDVIAIDQDKLGVQGLRFKSDSHIEYWFKPLEGGDWAFCILNRTEEPVSLEINWQEFNLTDHEVSHLSTDFESITYVVRDLWNKPAKKAKEVTTKKNINVTVPGHDVLLYRLTPKTSKK